MSHKIRILDTTLRDGEQAPGFSMNLQDKIELSRQLEGLGVDVIEAGFPIVSKDDYLAVRKVAETVKNASVAAFCRALQKDIDIGYEAIRNAKDPMLHLFIATSDIHMQYKLKKSPKEVYNQAVEMVRYAKKLCPNVEFSAEDASRSDVEFLCKIYEGVIAAGATVINIPDTVGYATPDEMERLVMHIRNNVKGAEDVILSVHCHNDLGLAAANTLASAKAGAAQVECTINGIGERAGNAALEEVVMAIKTRGEHLGLETKIDSSKIYRASRQLSIITGVKVQPNKAIVGANAFAHQSGIHQHGMLANRNTYEIMTPESIGIKDTGIVLGRNSGRHAFDDYLHGMGYGLDAEQTNKLFERFKELSSKKMIVEERDIEALVYEHLSHLPKLFELDRFVINSGNTISSTAIVRLKGQNDVVIEKVSTGDGPISAAYRAIDKIVGCKMTLESYKIEAVTAGRDALGEVKVTLKYGNKIYKGRGLSTDIFEASILAYLAAINNMANITGLIREGDNVGI